jgi:D-alanyl-D-alanine carboxypeptidase
LNRLRAVCICLLGGITLAATAAAPAGLSVKKPTKLQQMARGLVKAGAPGAIVFVRTTKGTRSGVAGYANIKPRTPTRAVDRFRIASITKTFVATLVLELAADGKLGLDDTVERWLPSKVPNGSNITLRELLNHTSGLFNYTDDEGLDRALFDNPSRVWASQELLDLAFSHPPNFSPGTNWSYSNTNYVLLGLVIEAVTGKAVGDVLRERIIEPLKLGSTWLATTTPIPEPVLHGFFNLGVGGDFDVTSLISPTFSYAAGDIVSNAPDVTAFYAALLQGKLLPAPLLTQMKTPTTVSGTYGLGIDQRSTRCGRTFFHLGDFFGWRNMTASTANGKRQAVVVVNINSRVSWTRIEAAATSALCSG